MVESVRLIDQERAATRCLLVDQTHRVIAAFDGVGLLEEVIPLTAAGCTRGGRWMPEVTAW